MGPWYRSGSEATPGDQLEQMPTLRDAVFSGMTLDIFNRHPEKVAMGNCAQLINCLNSLYLAHEDKFCVTPVGHVFAMYAATRWTSLRTIFSVPNIRLHRGGKPAFLLGGLRAQHRCMIGNCPDGRQPGCQGRPRDGNRNPRREHTIGVGHHSDPLDIHAHNTFEQRNVVTPQSKTLEVKRAGPDVYIPAGLRDQVVGCVGLRVRLVWE